MCAGDSRPDAARFSVNTVVLPRGFPGATAVTNDVGYYPFRLRRADIVDREIALIYSGPDTSDVRRFYVGREDVGLSGNVRLPTVVSELPCAGLEYGAQAVDFARDSILAGARTVPSPRGSIGGRVIGAVATVIGMLRFVPLGGSAGANCDPSNPLCATGSDTTATGYAFASSTENQVNVRGVVPSTDPAANLTDLGFRFAPARDLTEAWLGNPGAVALAERSQAGVEFRGSEFARAYALGTFGERARLGLGVYRTGVEAPQSAAEYNWEGEVPRPVVRDTLTFPGGEKYQSLTANLASVAGKEESVSAFGAFAVHRTTSVGIAVRATRRSGLLPAQLRIRRYTFRREQCVSGPVPTCTEVDPTTLAVWDRLYGGGESWLDVDLGAVVRPRPTVLIGASLLTGRDLRVAGRADEGRTMLSVGVGGALFLRRVHLGTDILLTSGLPADFSFGMSWVVFDNVTVRWGVGSSSAQAIGVQVAGVGLHVQKRASYDPQLFWSGRLAL